MLSKIDEPPSKIFLVIFLVIALIVILSIGRQVLIERFIDNEVEQLSMSIAMNSALLPIVSVYYRDPEILAVLAEIIKRESNGNPTICNKEQGCKAGQGLTQLIPSTVKYCEEKLNKEIDPFNPDENTECALWLLENEGIRHWEEWSGPYYF